jgi:hypothetical protein
VRASGHPAGHGIDFSRVHHHENRRSWLKIDNASCFRVESVDSSCFRWAPQPQRSRDAATGQRYGCRTVA